MPRQLLWAAVALFLFAGGLYAQSSSFDYTLDDNAVIASNRWVQQGLRGVLPLLQTHFFEGYFSAFATYYRPLSMITFAVEFEFFGFDPVVSHTINVVLYALSSLVVLRLAWELLQQLWPAVGATALWVASPLHVEVAANIKSRDEILAFAFNALFILFALRFVRTGDRRFAGWSAACFGLALFTKESALTFLLVLPLTLFSFTKLPWRKVALNSLLAVPGTLVYFLARHSATGHWWAAPRLDTEPVGNNLLLAADGTAEMLATCMKFALIYLRLLFWPDPLSWDYSIGQVTLITWSSPLAWLGLAVLVGLVGLIAWRLRRGDVLGWCLAFAAITYAIPSNLLVKVVGATLAERYLYPLTFGFCVLVAWGVLTLLKDRRRLALGLLAALTLAWTARSLDRIPDWQNNDALILSNADLADGNPRMVGSYGSFLNGAVMLALKDEPERVEEWDRKSTVFFERQLELAAEDPHQYRYVEAPARWGLAMNAFQQGRTVEALPHLRVVVDLEPANAPAWWHIGFIEYDLGNYDASVEAYETSLSVRAKTAVVPGDNVLLQDYYLNLCLAQEKAGHLQAALTACDEAIFWQKSYAKAHAMRGNILVSLGRVEEGSEALEHSFELDPSLRPAP